MEKKQAQEFIKQVLNSRFDQEQFELFVRNLLNEFEPRDNNYSGNLIPEAFRDHIAHYKRIGKYIDPEGEPMDILIVQTRSVNKLERTRTALRNFVVRHLKNFDKYYALVAFYSKEDDGREWRLSLVKIDIEQERTENGKIKAKEEIVPARRFSFLVGENENVHTAQKQLLPLLVNDHSNPIIIKEKDGDGSVEGAFSIEKVTDEFYEQYKELYLKLIENADLTETLENADLDPVRFVKKLLGQIVFLYFLQKKGWLGVPKDQKMGEGPKNFLRKKFYEINEALHQQGQRDRGSYFNNFLRYLFYDALAKEHNDEGIKYYNKRLGCKIPFLNGGLFEADYENWATLNLNIDNLLFSNPNEKTKAGDKGTGILDVFDRYNFTIREDEPLEKEVAVDPEMLGKVFENLLDVKDRKSKGAFYTPREIVHYMCQESLIHYLDNRVNHYLKSYQSIDSDQTNLFRGSSDKKGNQPSRPAGLKIEFENKGDILIQKEQIEKYIRESTTALENDEDYFETQARIKRGEIKSTDKKLYLDKSIYSNAEKLDKALADIKICDPAIGSGAFPVGLLHELVSTRKVLRKHLSKNYLEKLDVESSNDLTDYYYKRHAIQESIYGVDIDTSAIDIARLRLWLSMIVDEEDYEAIDALPNLDYKIVCGNSLIGFPKDWQSPAFDKIEALKNDFFDETDASRKKELKRRIDTEIQKRLDTSERVFGYKIDFDFKLFFSEVWHFNKGFDIVIGNPPYVEHKKLKAIASKLKPLYKEVYSGSADLSVYFFERGYQILKEEGVLTYINTNKFFNTGYGRQLRKYLLKYRINFIVNFEQVEIFEKVLVSSVILNGSKILTNPDHAFDYVEFLKEKNWKPTFFERVRNERNEFKQYLFTDDEWVFLDDSDLKIRIRIEENSQHIKSTNGINIRRGVTTGFDPAFILDERDELIGSDPLIKPLLRGREIKRYSLPKTKQYIIFTRRGVNIENHPLIEEHLINFKTELTPRTGPNQLGRKPGKYAWYEIQDNTAYYRLFEEDKIIWPLTADKWGFTLDRKGRYLTSGGFFLISKRISLKYILALLNSNVLEYYFKFVGVVTAGGAYTLKKATIEILPIKVLKDQEVIIQIVDYILFTKTIENEFVSQFFEALLNGIVFEIYFDKEIQSANKQILPHLCDLKPITDEMKEEEKLAIIQSEFERLYDPNHPVRNNLETLDSVEEVRIIKEALK